MVLKIPKQIKVSSDHITTKLLNLFHTLNIGFFYKNIEFQGSLETLFLTIFGSKPWNVLRIFLFAIYSVSNS